MKPILRSLPPLALALCIFGAELPARFVGTVASIAVDKGTAGIKNAAGETVEIHLTETTIFQRVGPGEKNLKNAQPIQASAIAPGDRVLVNLDPATAVAIRVVVMSASEIAKHDEADRESWTTRGVGGVVTAKIGNALTLRVGTGAASSQAEVTVSPDTKFRKYAPDSVNFADAKASSLDEVKVGDQLRARGEKSPDGAKVAAGEVVFGSFVTKAGKIASVDVAANTVTIQELNTGKTLRILVAPGSQVKAIPDFAAMGGPPPAGGPPVGGMRPGAGPGPGGMPGMRQGGPPDPARMIEFLPAATLASFKPGQTVVVSSTRGAKEDELTAIVLLGNAEMLIRMASAQGAGAPRDAGGQSQPNMAAGMGGMTGGFELPTLVP